MKLTCVIVDDEYLAVKILENYVASIPSTELLKSFKNPLEAIDFLQNNPTDLLFLDIQMPHVNGIELLGKLTHKPLVVFTTARHEFAVQAFELDVLDYLVKPISSERFGKTVKKAQEYLYYINHKNESPTKTQEYLMVKCDYKIVKLLFEEIVAVEGFGEYVKIITVDKKYITLITLKELESQLAQSSFVRIHKSFIISLSKIKSYSHTNVELSNGLHLPIGRMYKDEFLLRVK